MQLYDNASVQLQIVDAIKVHQQSNAGQASDIVSASLAAVLAPECCPNCGTAFTVSIIHIYFVYTVSIIHIYFVYTLAHVDAAHQWMRSDAMH